MYSVKKGVLRNFTKFTGKHLCQSLFFNKVAGGLKHIKTFEIQQNNLSIIVHLPIKDYI